MVMKMTALPISDRKQGNSMPLDETYFVWLYSQVGSVKNRNRAKTYWELLRLLYQKEFMWSNPMDANRAQDGKDLRYHFRDETGTDLNDNGWLDYGCSMLELLVALSAKLAFEGEGEVQDWFWDLIDNLGLTGCTDANPPDPNIIEEILDKVIRREYAPNGAGGLFPLAHSHEDQRDVEIWYQAQAYLLERL